jgi:hypothetical protein
VASCCPFWEGRKPEPSRVLFTLIANTHPGRSPLQAHLVCETASPSRAAADFLEINGIDTSPLSDLATYEAMIRVAKHELDRSV